MTIQILDESTINKIAAGEVIERPSSALKELLENSADSGASHIEVDFDQGGKKYLKVLDNGSGMTLEELPLALSRHATSKITDVGDLERLSTFGFRGEALASLAGVSHISIHSSQKNAQSGGQIMAIGGFHDGPKPAAPLSGTTIVVKDLFYNIPARLKFLKSDGAETGAIKKVFKAFALSHPQVTLILRQNQKLLFHFPPQDFVNRACYVLDLKEKDVISLSQEEPGMKLQAVLGLPEVNTSTQQGIWIFVQGRPVIDKSLQFAIMEGYRNLVMHHQYPQAVLWLKVDPTQVDVNVHPTKAQVKFLDNGTLFRFVSQSVRQALEKKFSLQQKATPYVNVQESYQPELIRDAVTKYNQRQFSPYVNSIGGLDVNPDVNSSSFDHSTPQELFTSAAPVSSPLPSPMPTSTLNDTFPAPPLLNVGQAWSGLHLIGQYANTYLVCQTATNLILVDQHASHERVLFERLKAQAETGRVEKQMSLLEELIELSTEMAEALTQEQHRKLFDSLGFEFFLRGPGFISVTGRPSYLKDVLLKPLFERLGEQIMEFNQATALNDLRGEMWNSMACHGAIRAGRVLSADEMKSLLRQMDEFAFSSFCPHGRPVSVKMALYDIEKLFKRIV